MAQLDTQTLGNIYQAGPDIPGAMARGVELKDMVDREKLNALTAQEKQKDYAENEQLAKIWAGIDPNDPDSMNKAFAKAAQINPQKAMKVGREHEEYQGARNQNLLAQYQMMAVKKDAMWSELKAPADTAMQAAAQAEILASTEKDPARAQQIRDQAYAQADSAVLTQMGQAISRLKTMKLPNGKPAFDEQDMADLQQKLSSGQAGSATKLMLHLGAGVKQFDEEYDKLMGRKKDVAQIANLKGEAEHRKVEEQQGWAKINLAKQNASGAGFGGQRGELMAALAERGAQLPAGFRSKSQQTALLQGLIDRNPGKTVDEIADMVVTGQLSITGERAASRAAGGFAGRVAVGEKEIETFGPAAIAASQAVPRGGFKPITKLEQLGQENISDPALKNLYVRTNALLNAYDVVAARGGTDIEKRRENRRNVEMADSPQAYEVAVKAMMYEAQLAQQAAQGAMGDLSHPNAPRAAPPPPAPGNSSGAAIDPKTQELLRKYPPKGG